MPDNNYSPIDRDLSIRTMLGEAEDQPDIGLAGVAHVIKNRQTTGKWGDTLSDVVLSRNQFEPWQRYPRRLMAYSPQSPTYQRAAAIFDGVMHGDIEDPTEGSTHFYSPGVQSALGRRPPQWAKGDGIKIAGHVFYAPEGRVEPDDLGDYAKSLGKAAPTQAAPQEEDLLGNYAKGLPEGTQPAAPSAVDGTVKPYQAGATPEDTIPKLVNRLEAEHQGTSLSDKAIRLGAGAVRGIGDVADTLAQGIGYAGEKGAGALSKLGVISPETAQSVADWHAGINQGIAEDAAAYEKAAGNSGLANVGRIGGQIAGTAPLLGAAGTAVGGALGGSALTNALAARPVANLLVGGAARGAGIGAGTSLLTSASSNEPLGEQVGSGALSGAVLGPVGEALGGGLSRVGSQTANLAKAAMDKYGIPITAGQISSNPMVNFAENVLRKLPGTGYAANTEAQNSAFTRAIAKEIGQDTDRITRGTIKDAKKAVGPIFDKTAANAGTLPLDSQFVHDIGSIVSDARSVLGDQSGPVENQIQHIASVVNKAGGGSLDGKTYQALTTRDSTLSQLQRNGGNARDYANRIRKALDDLLERHARPEDVAELREARRKWAAIKTVEPLANKAVEGRISPALLQSKVKNEGNLSELGEIGQRFLKPPPSSGTAERSLIMHGLQFGAGFGLGELADPEAVQRNLLFGAAALGAGGTVGRLAAAGLRSRALARSAIGANPNRLRIPIFPVVGASAANVLAAPSQAAPDTGR